MSERPTEATVRAALVEALGDDRLEGVPGDALLLRRGLVTSIELVTLMVALEARFGRSLPEAAMGPQTLSIRSLVAALGGEAEAAAAPPERRAVPRPVIALITLIMALFALDRGVGLWARTAGSGLYAEFSEEGERLYPVAGGFSQDDFRFATMHHEIREPSRGPRVLVFGDSGTIGSYVTPAEAIPAQVEVALREHIPDAEVMNLAWFGRLLVKDLMILEAVWDEPFDAVVFTLGQDYFSTRKVGTWLSKYRHTSVNWPLYEDFAERIPAGEREPFTRLLERLRAADRTHDGSFRRFLFAHTEIEHYRPFLRYLFLEKLVPRGAFFSPLGFNLDVVGKRRVLSGREAQLVRPGLPPETVETDVVDVLTATTRLLEERGVEVVFYVEPTAPADWPREEVEGRKSGLDIASAAAKKTGATVVDASWMLDAEAFIDSQAHYEPEANARIGRAIGAALAAVLTSTTEAP